MLPLAIRYLLKYLVDAKLLTVAKINMRIARFDYGTIESSNKPRDNLTNSQLHGGDSLKQSGKHNVTYVRTHTYNNYVQCHYIYIYYRAGATGQAGQALA